MNQIKLIITFILFTSSSFAWSFDLGMNLGLDLATETGFIYHNIEDENSSYHPISVVSKIAYQLDDTKAIELHIGTGIVDDEVESNKYEAVNITGIYYRVGSHLKSKFRTYVLLGGTSTTWDVSTNIGSKRVDNSGLSWGLGFEERLTSARDMSFTLVYMSYYKEQNVRIEGITAGYRVDF